MRCGASGYRAFVAWAFADAGSLMTIARAFLTGTSSIGTRRAAAEGA
jgi:hypothetical protein